MAGRKPADVGKRGRIELLVVVEEQKIGDGEFVETVGNTGMKADAIQGVADNQVIAHVGVKERLYAEMVTRTEKLALQFIPDGEGKIPEQMCNTFLAPNVVGMEDQFHIGSGNRSRAPRGPQLGDQLGTSVNAGVGSDPDFPVEAERLAFVCRFIGGPQQGVCESETAADADPLRIGATERQRRSHPAKELNVNGGAIKMQEAGNATHGSSARIGETEPSKAANRW